MFCEKCGSEFAESQKFCGGCGTSLSFGALSGESQPKPSKFKKIAFWSLVILVCFGYLSHAMVEGMNSSQDTSAVGPEVGKSTVQAQTVAADSAKEEAKTFQIGEPFSVGYWSYRCNKAFWTPFLGFDPYSPQRASGDFIVVDLTARNDDKSESTLPPFHLVDSEGRTYDESAAGSMSQGFFSVLDGLNPGVTKRGMVAFDVPIDRKYSLVASGGMESSEKVTVALPTYEAQKRTQQVPEASY